MATTHAQAPDKGFQLHELTSSANDDQVQAIMALSARVFASVPSDPNTHSSLAFWRMRLADPKASIVVASTTTTAADESPVPLGFFFNFPRTQEELGFETLHLWLAGVAEESRGRGIFPALLEMTVKRARSLGYEYMTVGTVPNEFPKMFRILQAHGWEIVSWRDGKYGSDDQSVLMKMKL